MSLLSACRSFCKDIALELLVHTNKVVRNASTSGQKGLERWLP